nr:hypothetical protein [uncultured Pseudomonas sp.]
MEAATTFARAVLSAELLLESDEIEHVISLITEDSHAIQGGYLVGDDMVRHSQFGPAALLAARIRTAFRECFEDYSWALDTPEDIAAAQRCYSRYFHGQCLLDALRLAHIATTHGLSDAEFWQLRARLEQITSMALFGIPGAPLSFKLTPRELEAARQDGEAKRNIKVASSGGAARASKLFGHFNEAAIKALPERAYGADGAKMKKAAVARAILKNDLESLADSLKKSGSDLGKAVPTLATVEKWISAAYKDLPQFRSPA